MVIINTIIEGRKLIDEYRKNKKSANTEQVQLLVQQLNELGWKSINEFFNDNEKLIKSEINKMYEISGSCCRCGACCVDCDKLEDGNICTIYAERINNGKEFCVFYPQGFNCYRGLFKSCSYTYVKTNYEPQLNLN